MIVGYVAEDQPVSERFVFLWWQADSGKLWCLHEMGMEVKTVWLLEWAAAISPSMETSNGLVVCESGSHGFKWPPTCVVKWLDSPRLWVSPCNITIVALFKGVFVRVTAIMYKKCFDHLRCTVEMRCDMLLEGRLPVTSSEKRIKNAATLHHQTKLLGHWSLLNVYVYTVQF